MIYTLRRFAVLHISSTKSLTHVTISALQLSHNLQKYKTLHITVHSGCTDHIMCITDCLPCDAKLQGHSVYPIHIQKMLHYGTIMSVKSTFSNTILVNYSVSLIQSLIYNFNYQYWLYTLLKRSKNYKKQGTFLPLYLSAFQE